ncbi:MAG: transcription antitermination factor NusB [Acidimicrobiia bacterium]
MTTRRVALNALVRIDRGAFAHRVLPPLLAKSSLKVNERAQVTDWVYGTTRMRRRLDHAIAAYSKRPIVALDPDIRSALRLGAYQLMSGHKPYSAVNETCRYVREDARGYVNAILRSLSTAWPTFEAGASDEDWGFELSYPDWIVSRFRSEFGDAAAWRVLAAGNEPAMVTLRCRPGALDLVKRELKGTDRDRPKWAKDSIVVNGLGWPKVAKVIERGDATVQDQASQLVVRELAPRPGERILEIGAAPGGKSTAIAEWVGKTGLVVALDIHAGRVRAIRRAARRLQQRNVIPITADGTKLPLMPGAFDRVLVDAPCTGLGVLRRRPDARWRIKADHIAELAELQRRLLFAGAAMVRPGGVLVYSVCTLTREETIGIEADFAMMHPEFQVEPIEGEPWKPRGSGGMILPIRNDLDGMFVLRWRRPEIPD